LLDKSPLAFGSPDPSPSPPAPLSAYAASTSPPHRLALAAAAPAAAAAAANSPFDDMAAIAIPSAQRADNEVPFFPLSCSPLSRSPFAHQLSLSPGTGSAPKYSSVVPPASHFAPATAQVGRKPSVSYAARPPRASLATRDVEVPLPVVHSGPIIDNFRQALADIDMDDCEAHGENAFFVADLGEVYRQHQRWMRELGQRVQPFFAVKSNPDPYVLRLMAALGLGFDCASQPEISAVLALPGTINPSRIIYANPCKAASFIRHAAKHGVDTMTFDNADELAKVKKYHPGARMVLRILTDDSSSLCRLGLKFGAPLGEVRGLLKRAKQLDVNVVGISFHCGSGCKDPSLFGDAIRRARWAFDVGKEEGFDFDLLDIGGGFEDNNFEEIAAVLRDAIAVHFPLDAQGRGVKIIAEPGRYYVCRAFELATNIIARRAAREGTNDEASMLELAGVDDDEESKPITMCASSSPSLTSPSSRSGLSLTPSLLAPRSRSQTTSTTASTRRSTRPCSTTRSSSLTSSRSATSSSRRPSPRRTPAPSSSRARSGARRATRSTASSRTRSCRPTCSRSATG